MSASSFVHLDVLEIKAETEKALLLELEDQEVWVPKSVIADVDDYQIGNKNCTVSVQEWFATKENLCE